MDRSQQREEMMDNDEPQGFQQMVVLEVMRGCRMAQDLERKLMQTPHRVLTAASTNPEHALLRTRVIGMAASIVTTFSNVISYLHSLPKQSSCLRSSYGDQEVQPKPRESSSPSYSSSPMCSAKSWPSSATPLPPIQTLEEYAHPSSPLCPTPTPPQSPSTITSAKRSQAPSPKPSSLDMDSAIKLPMVEFEPIPEARLDPESNDAPVEASSRGRSKQKAESLGADANEHISIAKRRKCMPKWTVVVPSSNSEQGSEAVPSDGYTWRKYGQKDILGSRHPRSYYRCTHKTELGCLAIKYVQKSDEDPPVYHVTYKGDHTCRSSELYRPHARLYPNLPVTEPQSRLPFNSTCLTLGLNGALQLGQFGPTNNFHLTGQTGFQTLTPNSDSPLLLKPPASFSMPDIARTPKFGYFSSSSNADPTRSTDFHGAKTLKSECNSELINKLNEQAKVRLLQGSGGKDTERVKFLHEDPREIMEADDEMHAYDRIGYECGGELLSPSASEVVSNCVPLELIQRRYGESKSFTSPPLIGSESEISEVVAENMPDFRFDLDSIMDLPYTNQHLLDLQPLNHELF